MAEANWYVAHTYSGYENKVKTNIEQTIINRNLQDQIFEVLVPMEEVQEEKKTVQRKLFPGYVFVNMIMNDDTWYVVRNTRGVTGFVGPGSKPVPLTETEIKALGAGGFVSAPEAKFKVGDVVKVISGAWSNRIGKVEKVNTDEHTVTLKVEDLNNISSLTLDFSEVEKQF